MTSLVRIFVTIFIVITCTLVAWVGGGMALIILSNGSIPNWAPVLGYVLPISGVVTGMVISFKLFGGKPPK